MKNYLIVGGGLAGITVAHQLEKIGKTFDLIDENANSNSSKVAAGFWNPIVFKRLTMSYNADKLLPTMKQYYSSVEHKLGGDFFYSKPLLKIFSSLEERHRFIDKAIVSEVSQLLEEEIVEAVQGIDAPYGMGLVRDTGYIDTVSYIESSIKHFQKSGNYEQSRLSYSEIIFKKDWLEFRGKRYGKVVFCEGFQASENPYFPELRLKPAKGELLTVCIPDLKQDYAFAKGVGLIPIGEQNFTVGSTYDWDDMSEHPTQKAKDHLLEKLNDYLRLNFTLVGHEAGIRPASYDRRPILGQSKINEKAYILNGFGTKGVLYAPFYSKMLVKSIENGIKLEEDIDYKRMW